MLRNHVLATCFAAALLLAPARASAKLLTAEDLMNMPLERLVKVEVLITGASKYAEKASEAPSIVEVITADDIRTYGYKTLGDAINGMHGVYVTNDRRYTSIGTRGFSMTSDSNSRVLVMIDGRRMNENVYDSAYVGQEFMLDMSLVDRIEYIPGPGSSMYGANAMMGVINVVTKTGAKIGGLQTEVAYGTYDTGTAKATFGRQLPDGTDVLLAVSGYTSDGPDRIYFPELDDGVGGASLLCDPCDGFAVDMDAERSKRVFAKIQKGGLTLTSGFVDRFKRVPTSPFTTFIPAVLNDKRHTATDRQAYGELKYNKALNDKSSLDLKAYYHWYDSISLIPHVNSFGFDFGVDNSSYTGRWVGSEATFVTTAFDRHKIVVGAEFQYDIDQQLYAFNNVFCCAPFGLGIWQNSNNSGLRSGFYAQDAITLRDNLVLNLGLRLDQHHMIEKLQLNPRLGLIWNPEPSTTVKLLYGSAFRAPNIFERSYNGVVGWQANPFNREENIKNYEAAVEWRGRDGLKLSGSVFYNDFTDVLGRDPTFFSAQFVNAGHLESAGVDLGLEKKWPNGREVKAFYNHSEYLTYTGIRFGGPFDSPKNVARALYREPLFDGRAMFGLENIFVGARKTIFGATGADSYYTANATLSSDELIPGVDMAFSVYNMFDSPVDMASPWATLSLRNIPMNGRTVMLTARKTF